MSKLVKEIMDALNAANMNKTQPYDRQGTVKRIEGKIAWVKLEGSDLETPVQMTIACDVGDTVQARIGGGSAWLTGNLTAPPTDDKKATQAMSMATTIIQQVKEDVDDELDKLKDEIESIETSDIVSIIPEYCLSESRSEFIQYGQWSEEVPEYQTGYYYYQRQKITLSDGRVVYTDPVYSQTAQVIAEANEAAQTAQEAADDARTIADSALGKATTTEQHFWYDSTGAHVSENANHDLTTGASQTIASNGTVMLQNGKLVTSWTNGAVNFYDGSYATARTADLIASYSRSGITQYINNNKTIALTPSALSFFDPTDGETPEAIFGSGGVNLYSGGKLSASLESGAQTFYAADGITKVAQFSGDGVTFYDSNDSPMVKLRADTFDGYTRAQFINDTYAYDSTIGLYSTPTTAQLSLGAEDVGILLYCSSSNKFVRVTADDLSVSGYYASNGYKLLTVTREMIKDNLSIAAGSYNDSITKTLSKTGYTPIGIVGHNIRNASDTGMNGSHCFLFRCYIDGTTLKAGIRNKGSNDAIIRLDLEVLWIATTQGI